jgi:hypothetical protein
MDSLEKISQNYLEKGIIPDNPGGWKVYPHSIHKLNKSVFFIAGFERQRLLIVIGNEELSRFRGEVFFINSIPAKKCLLTPDNAKAMMELFPFTRPSSMKGKPFSMGFGDRLGLASQGHLQLLRTHMNVFPVLAQQSMREITLTGRTYADVLASAVFAVFQEDWQGGYGADGDHLKTPDEIYNALDCGYTMITLDCSEHIYNIQDSRDVDAAYNRLPEDIKTHYENQYREKTFSIGDMQLNITADMLKSIVLIYHRAIDYAEKIYNEIIKNCKRSIDFEISIDETASSTSPEAHFIFANELINRSVDFVSMAPRFIGEFQKGIDYIGNLDEFEKDFIVHEKIARHFGYKLSIHSGSDKFSVFSIIGKYTKLNVHVKTAGTNWLEALRVIAIKDPSFFRRIYQFAIAHFIEAKAYYHISSDPSNLAPLDTVPDEKLVDLFDILEARQLLHITYGLLLQASLPEGSRIYYNRVYEILRLYEDDYYLALKKHLGHHIQEIQNGTV